MIVNLFTWKCLCFLEEKCGFGDFGEILKISN